MSKRIDGHTVWGWLAVGAAFLACLAAWGTLEASCVEQYEAITDNTTTATRSGINVVYDGDRAAGQWFGYNYFLALREWTEFDGSFNPNAMAGEPIIVADLIQYVPSNPYGEIQGEPVGVVVGTFELTRNGYFADTLHGWWTKHTDYYGEECAGICEGPIDYVLVAGECDGH